MHGAEFDFQAVYNGTNTPLPPLPLVYMTFFDVDGDRINGGLLYEFVSVLGASVLQLRACC